jgi:hypothetical protein
MYPPEAFECRIYNPVPIQQYRQKKYDKPGGFIHFAQKEKYIRQT